ncbi:biotin carboxylase [Agrococcus sp. SGAir0287]|nr:biotin carboxylase [Agrococcus sp. SGAir0287]
MRVLVTGAGGPAGVAAIRSLLRRDDVDVVAADMDGWASGLYLVDADARRLVPAGAAEGFVPALAALVDADRIDVVALTVDAELRAVRGRRDEVAATFLGVDDAALDVCLDKWHLAQACADTGRAPETALLDDAGVGRDWAFPVVVKPREGAGSRGVEIVATRAVLESMPRDEGRIVQAHLPGDEFSVDVLVGPSGPVVAVPRLRARVDSGVAVAGRTVRDPDLEDAAIACARAAGIVGVANVQLRRDAVGRAMLLEINPRFSGGLPLVIAAGADLPSLALDLALGRPLPERVDVKEVASVRYLEDVVVPVDAILGAG